MSLQAGQRLGPYEIVAPIGAGGMGAVYRAHDTRLKRDVALKVLPPGLTADAGRRQRFEVEARAAAALNHPNVVAIYDVGDADGVSFLVSELVDGTTLRGVRPGLRRTLDYATQMASGLAAAHAAGVVHRDLKPDNVLIARDGRIKILDFGLAKVTAAAPALAEMVTVGAGTGAGVVLGTVGYMSPEQVRGEAADYRSDIFSFGVIVHELLAGQRAFDRATSVETMTAILTSDPPDLPTDLPPAIRQIVAHCLEKDPHNRFQSARDLTFALGTVSQQTGSQPAIAAVGAPRRSLGRGVLVVAVTLLVVAATAGVTRRLTQPAATPSWSGGMLGGPDMALDPRLSPDGHLLAFQAIDRGFTQVAIMKPETGNWSLLTRSRDQGVILSLAWSADGASIYYDRVLDVPRGIYRVPVLGGEEKLVLENAWAPEALPDGTILLFRSNAKRQIQMFRFWPETGRLQDFPLGLASIYSSTFSARASRDGKLVVARGILTGHEDAGMQVVALDLDKGTARPLYTEPDAGVIVGGGAITRDGEFLTAVAGGSLTRIVSMPLQRVGTPRTLFTVASAIWNLEASPDGSVYATLYERPAEVVRRSIGGDRSERVAAFPVFGVSDAITALADGRAVTTLQASGKNRLAVIEPDRDPAPLINTAEETSAPATMVGPRRIAFMIGPAPHRTIALADVASGRIVGRHSPARGEIQGLAASPDGQTLYFSAGKTIWSMPADGGDSKKVRAGDGVVADPSGQSLVVNLVDDTKLRFFRVFADGRPEREIVPDGSVPIMGWPTASGALHADGRLLVPLQDAWFNRPAILDTNSSRITRIPSDDASDYHSMAWLPDGRILALHIGLRATLWRFQPDGATTSVPASSR